jgi:hypothetical protein
MAKRQNCVFFSIEEIQNETLYIIERLIKSSPLKMVELKGACFDFFLSLHTVMKINA